MLKHHCEGFKGWWETCPTADFVLQPGTQFTPSQLEILVTAGLVMLLVLLAASLLLLTALFASSLEN